MMKKPTKAEIVKALKLAVEVMDFYSSTSYEREVTAKDREAVQKVLEAC